MSGTDNNENNPPIEQPTPTPVTITLSGGINQTITGNKGAKLSQILTAASVTDAGNYNFRQGTSAFSQDRVITEDITLTTVAKASGG
jgi:hypothetical protein